MTETSRSRTETPSQSYGKCPARASTWRSQALHSGEWGLRDYGTGTWTGGDDTCDHGAERVERRQDGRQTGLDGGTPGSSRDPIATACKCGARRIDQQHGLEPTPELWAERLVAVFRELRRVLRSDGTCWIECGDSYSDKQLVGAPWKLAFALQVDGWHLRQCNTWFKRNCMPESVSDRFTTAHSFVFMLSKKSRYFFDADAVREGWTDDRNGASGATRSKYADVNARGRPGGDGGVTNAPQTAGRNGRTVWDIPTEAFSGAHFATFPQKLVERAILAGTSEHGCCAECGAPWRRVVEREVTNPGNRSTNGQRERSTEMRGFDVRREIEVTTTGWEPTCTHHAGITPAIVCDPFMGSGTTALVARRLGRHSVGIELSAEYLAIARTRLQQLSLLGGTA